MFRVLGIIEGVYVKGNDREEEDSEEEEMFMFIIKLGNKLIFDDEVCDLFGQFYSLFEVVLVVVLYRLLLKLFFLCFEIYVVVIYS